MSTNLANQISNNPFDRLPVEMKKLLENETVKFDVHTHIFDYDHVPNSFFGTRLPFSKNFLKSATSFLDNLFDSKDDMASHMANFFDLLNKNTMRDIAKKMFELYNYETYVFCILMMDMEFGIEKPDKEYENQCREILEIRNEFPDKILPFFGVDPRRPDIYNRFLQAFTSPENFFGVKVYPALGYLPSDPVLMQIFEICEQKNIPITTHCGGYAVHSTNNDIEVRGLKLDEKGEYQQFAETVSFSLPKSHGDYFNTPLNWEPVLKKFPKLKLNLAHFGGGGEWEVFVNQRKNLERKSDSAVSQIIDLMYRYKNVYADFAYTMSRPYFYETLRQLIEDNKVIGERVMYGTDFYMIAMEGLFRCIKTDFMTAMGDKIMTKIASENPLRFLFG